MSADWDLFAVVRSCKSTANKAGSSVASTRSSKENNTGCNCLASLKLEEAFDPFTFHSMSRRASLQDSRRPFHSFKQPDPSTMATNPGKNPTFLSPTAGGASGQHHLLQQQAFTMSPAAAPGFTFGQVINQLPTKPQWSSIRAPQPEVPLPRTRKRRNKNQNRTVSRVTGDDIDMCSDQWSWRKYGQKPIKGSPHPRHYYRCSSSKVCLARKHVERSNSEPDTFIVTYTGDHIHSKPKSRKSLAGRSRRDKLSEAKNASSSSFSSPTTPLPAPGDGATATVTNVQNSGYTGVNEGENVNIVAHEKPTVAENYDDEDIIMIPNEHVYEDLFQGLGELMRSAGGGSSTGIELASSWPAFAGNFSSWGTSKSASSSAAGRG